MQRMNSLVQGIETQALDILEGKHLVHNVWLLHFLSTSLLLRTFALLSPPPRFFFPSFLPAFLLTPLLVPLFHIIISTEPASRQRKR